MYALSVAVTIYFSELQEDWQGFMSTCVDAFTMTFFWMIVFYPFYFDIVIIDLLIYLINNQANKAKHYSRQTDRRRDRQTVRQTDISLKEVRSLYSHMCIPSLPMPTFKHVKHIWNLNAECVIIIVKTELLYVTSSFPQFIIIISLTDMYIISKNKTNVHIFILWNRNFTHSTDMGLPSWCHHSTWYTVGR